MKWASKVSEEFALKNALDECVAHVRAELGDARPDLAVLFISPHHAPDFEDLPAMLQQRLSGPLVLGCSGGGVIGGGKEVEDRTGLALTVASLPGVQLTPFHVEDKDLPDLDATPAAWEKLVSTTAEKEADFVLLADPFTMRADALLAGMDYAFPGRVKVGGLASGAGRPGGNALFLQNGVYHSGAVGVAVSGAVRVEAIVAQGCRPVGKSMVVTECQRNIMLSLDGQKPIEVLRALYQASDERDRALLSRALHIGVVTDPLKEEFHPGDFLIRNVMGVDPDSGGLAVGELLREGQVVQFHVRDAQTAEEELHALLGRYSKGHAAADSAGALLFSCLGRGIHMFGRPDHDTEIFRKHVGPMPLGGFFCNGEIGPVGPGTFLHGFTSSFALFRPRDS